MVSAVCEPITGVQGWSTQWGPGTESVVMAKEAKPPKLKVFVHFHTKEGRVTGCAVGKNDFCSVLFFFRFGFCTVCCLMWVYSTESFPVYFRAELVQLTVSRSDSELEEQRYGKKKNTLTVDPVMLEDEL